jgi:uncharacterized protein YbdZ (MbtH family)
VNILLEVKKMSWNDSDREDTTIYKVVVNHEEQYSIWPEYKENPLGWRDVGKAGPKAECLAFIKEIWTDMRPLSLRKKMEEWAKNPPPPPPPVDPDAPREKSLVDRLCEGRHAVEVSLRPDKSLSRFTDAIERNYVFIKFTGTKGGTELGVGLDSQSCDLRDANFESGTGTAHLVGGLTLDYVNVQCVADIDLETFQGTGHLVKLGAA